MTHLNSHQINMTEPYHITLTGNDTIKLTDQLVKPLLTDVVDHLLTYFKLKAVSDEDTQSIYDDIANFLIFTESEFKSPLQAVRKPSTCVIKLSNSTTKPSMVEVIFNQPISVDLSQIESSNLPNVTNFLVNACS